MSEQGRPLGPVLTGAALSDYDAVEDLMALPVNEPNALLAGAIFASRS